MKKFEILPHTADLKLRAYGRTKQEVFLNMLKAMAESQKAITSSERTERKVKISSSDLASLLVDFLSEVLYLTQVNKEVYLDVKFKEFSDTELKAELIGQKVKRFGEDIKAVTYHNLEVRRRKDGTWQATVLFDI